MADLVVETSAGKVRTSTVDGVYAFRGIPYGGDMGGGNRFLPPVSPEPWPGVWHAIKYGPSAPQLPARRSPLDHEPEKNMSEDCLRLNVWTSGAGGRRPVLVWIHGGGFAMGSGSRRPYDGSTLARKTGAVVVTVNHRLGLLGYLYLGGTLGDEGASSGNVGMLDLIAALRWTRDNIERFGGDPSRVLIFGVSGGGGKVSALLAMPDARGLFQRAAIQSGAYLCGPGHLAESAEQAMRTTEQVLAELGITRSQVGRLRDLPVDRLLQAQAAVEAGRGAMARRYMAFRPVLDGVALPAHPVDALSGGASANVPVLIGSNLHESLLFLAEEAACGDGEGVSEEQVVERLQPRWGEQAPGLVDAYRRTERYRSNFDLLVAITSDHMRLGGIRLAEARAAARKRMRDAAPVFMYLFTQESRSHEGRLRSCHGLDVPYVFDNVDASPISAADTNRHRLASQMSAAWVALAAAGAPSHDALPSWPAYTPTARSTMILDGAECRIENDPYGEERLAWDRVCC